MNELQGIWRVLGIAPTSDTQELRRAYLRKLKVTNPEDDAAAFQELREAYEWAVHMSAYGAFESDQPAERAPEPKPVVAQPPPRESPASRPDPALARVRDSLDTLERLLESDASLDEAAARSRLDDLLNPDNLQRFDILQMLDHELSALLARTIPRSDPLLQPAAVCLEWFSRDGDESRPPAAMTVLQRLKDLDFLRGLETAEGSAGRAWANLVQPPRRQLRWLQAYVFSHSSWEELDLLQHLEERHPALIDRLHPDNVAWWRRFASRPHLSGLTVAGGIIVGTLIALITYANVNDEPGHAPLPTLIAGTLGILLALGLTRLYLIEWPITLLQRHWHGYLPAWVRVGWLADGMLLLILGLLASNVPWLGWFLTVCAGLTACWAGVAAGPARPAMHPDRNKASLMNSRLVRIVVFNALAGSWLALAASELGDGLPMPLVITVAGVLAASAMGRDAYIEWFSRELTLPQQRACCGTALAVAVLLGWALLSAGRDPEWQPTLFVAIIACVVLRRGAPAHLSVAEFLGGYHWLGVFLIITFARLMADAMSHFLQLQAGADFVIVVGGLVFLAGVAVSSLRWLWLLRAS